MKKKILVLYTSIGLGHKFIAMNMVYHLQKDGYEVLAHDVLQLQEGWTVNLGKRLHAIINTKFPFIWRWLYLSKTFTVLTLPLRVPLAGGNLEHIKSVVDEFKPDIVISVHASASAAMAYMKRKQMFRGKFVIGFSDYHLHRYWLYDEADHYLANIEEQKTEMVRLGIASEKITVCGITLQPEIKIEPGVVKAKLGINDSGKVILLASGSLGIGFTAQDIAGFAKAILEKVQESWVVIVCGKNSGLKQSLDAMQIPRTIILGFYEPIAELYSISDLFLTKPGGLSTAEALQAGMRIIITHWLPGQEELNYEYLTRKEIIESMPRDISPHGIAEAVVAALAKSPSSDSEQAKAITQKNQEGKVFLRTIESL